MVFFLIVLSVCKNLMLKIYFVGASFKPDITFWNMRKHILCSSKYFARANILLLFSLYIHEISFLRFGPHSILTSYHRAFCRKLCSDFKDASKKLNLACWFSLVVNLIWWHVKSYLGSVHTSLSLFFNSWHVLFSCLTVWSVYLHGRVWSTGKKKKLQIHWLCSISIIYSSNVRFISISMLNHQFAFPYHFLHP